MKLSANSLIVLAMSATAIRADDNFRNCFCYQSNGQWCGAGPDNNFWRDSCRDWVTDALLWTIPAFVALIVFFIYPMLLFCARMCCNCCGGRQPSDGCCCPGKPSVRVFADGTEEPISKKYSNRSIFCTKFLFAACFGLWIYYSVGIYVLNHRVNNAFNDVTGAIDTQSMELTDAIANATSATSLLVENKATFLDSNLLGVLENAQVQYQDVSDDIHRIIGHLQHVESDQQWGRYQDAFRIPSIALVILVPAFFMMLCSCRGAALTIGSGLMSLTAVLVVGSFVAHELVAQASTALCNDYNDTMVPSVINAAIYGGGCGQASVTAMVDGTASGYFQQVCNAGLSEICNNGGFYCPEGAYTDLCVSASSTGEANLMGWGYLSDTLANTIAQSTTLNDEGCPSCTIQQCANYCASASLKNQCQDVVSFMGLYGASMSTLLVEFYPTYTNCTGLYDALISDSIQGSLCGEFSTQFTNISIQFLALSVLSIFATVGLLLGAKRFTKMEKIEETQTGSAFAYRVLLQTDEERAVMGSPLLANATPGVPQPTGPTAPQGGQGYYIYSGSSNASPLSAGYGSLNPPEPQTPTQQCTAPV